MSAEDRSEHWATTEAAYLVLKEAHTAVKEAIASSCLYGTPRDIDVWVECEKNLRATLSFEEWRRNHVR